MSAHDEVLRSVIEVEDAATLRRARVAWEQVWAIGEKNEPPPLDWTIDEDGCAVALFPPEFDEYARLRLRVRDGNSSLEVGVRAPDQMGYFDFCLLHGLGDLARLVAKAREVNERITKRAAAEKPRRRWYQRG